MRDEVQVRAALRKVGVVGGSERGRKVGGLAWRAESRLRRAAQKAILIGPIKCWRLA